MDLTEIINKRQSIRKYKDGDVPKDAILEMIEAARMAPSGKNVQNWHFIVVKDEALKEEIIRTVELKNEWLTGLMDTVDEQKAERFRKFVKYFTFFIREAPVLVVVMTREYKPSGYHEYRVVEDLVEDIDEVLRDIVEHRNPGMQSLGAAIEHFSLKCVELGYGSCWLTSANYAAAEIEELLRDKDIFDVEDYFLGCMLSVGIPEDNPKSPKRKPIENIYTYIE